MARSCAIWMLRALALIALIGKPLCAAAPWIRLTSQDFDLYSNLSPRRSRAFLVKLEHAREALSHISIYAASGQQPIRVITFRSLAEYRPYAVDKGSTAYFLHSATRDYIVLAADSSDFSDMSTRAVHEYSHYVVHEQFPNLPRWLDEGLADVYSTIEEKDGRVQIGLPLDERLEWIRMDGLVYNLPTLFQLRQDKLSNSRGVSPRSSFYAESWILTHMLRFSPSYERHFDDFLYRLKDGASSNEALEAAFHKPEGEIEQDLVHYAEAECIRTSVFPVDRAPAPPAPRLWPLPPADASAVLQDLAAVVHRLP